jgi:Aldo/keto reductase family
MQYTKLGNTGITVSRICLGCMSYGDRKWREWTVGADEARNHFAAALDSGVNFIDTAYVYSAGVSEEITGRLLGEMASRDDIVFSNVTQAQARSTCDQDWAQPVAWDEHRREGLDIKPALQQQGRVPDPEEFHRRRAGKAWYASDHPNADDCSTCGSATRSSGCSDRKRGASSKMPRLTSLWGSAGGNDPPGR